MTGHLVHAAFWLAVLATNHLWLRPRLRRRIATHLTSSIVTPLRRRLRNTRRTLAALARAAHHRPHRPAHALTSGVTDDHHEHWLAT